MWTSSARSSQRPKGPNLIPKGWPLWRLCLAARSQCHAPRPNRCLCCPYHFTASNFWYFLASHACYSVTQAGRTKSQTDTSVSRWLCREDLQTSYWTSGRASYWDYCDTVQLDAVDFFGTFSKPYPFQLTLPEIPCAVNVLCRRSLLLFQASKPMYIKASLKLSKARRGTKTVKKARAQHSFGRSRGIKKTS